MPISSATVGFDGGRAAGQRRRPSSAFLRSNFRGDTMALLTAEDILNKKFSATKFREGYDVEEVDDFLDEVVRTLTNVQEENEGLRQKVAAAERRIAELSRNEAAGSARAQAAPVAAPAMPTGP